LDGLGAGELKEVVLASRFKNQPHQQRRILSNPTGKTSASKCPGFATNGL
jgi:hypothetical protein